MEYGNETKIILLYFGGRSLSICKRNANGDYIIVPACRDINRTHVERTSALKHEFLDDLA